MKFNRLLRQSRAGWCLGILVAAATVASPGWVKAALVTLQDGGSTVQMDTSSQAGMNSWTVDGINELQQQWFWYRIGDGSQQSIDTLSQSVPVTSPTAMSVTYSGTGFDISLAALLTGGAPGSGTGTISEIITIDNTSDSPMQMHFFQYNNFTVNGSGANNTLNIATNTADQTDPLGNLAEVSVIPDPDHLQADTGSTLLTELNGGPTTLNDFAGPIVGDPNFAFEWDPTIAGGDTFIISVNKFISTGATVPLPPAAHSALATLAALGGIAVRRKMKLANPAR